MKKFFSILENVIGYTIFFAFVALSVEIIAARTHSHYDNSRYTIVNLHALFTKKTVEFRIFNGTLHAGEVKTAIQLCCALVANAKAAKRTLYKQIQTENERFAMRTWLTRPQGLNLNGEEFETLRHHLTKHLEGNAAWRYAIA